MMSSSMITRRGLIATAAACAAVPRARAAEEAWTRQAYEAAMAKSGRHVTLSDEQFSAIQARKPAAMRMIEQYLKSHLGHADPAVLQAFQTVPREYFHYLYEEHRATPGEAYETNPKTLGFGLRFRTFGLSRPGLHDAGLPAETWRHHARDRDRQRVPECCAVTHRRAQPVDRNHRAAGARGGQDLGAARLYQRGRARRRRLLRVAGGRRRFSISSSSPALPNTRRRNCSPS